MPPRTQNNPPLTRAALRRLRAEHAEQRSQIIAAARASAQTQSTQPYEADTSEGKYVKLLRNQSSFLSTKILPVGFHIRLTFELPDKHKPDGFTSGNSTRIFPEDRRTFQSISAADAFEEAQEALWIEYERAVVSNVEILPNAPAPPAPPPNGLWTWAPTSNMDDELHQPLRMGGPVIIDQGVPSAKPAYATPASYVAADDGECIARGLAEVAAARALRPGSRVILQARKKRQRVAARYWTAKDVADVLNEQNAERLEDGVGGATPLEIAEFIRPLQLHVIIVNRKNKVILNADHRTPTHLKNHSRPRTFVIIASNEHGYVLRDGGESTRIIQSVAQRVFRRSPGGERDPSVAVGMIVPVNRHDLASAGYKLDTNKSRVKLADAREMIHLRGGDFVPEFAKMKEAIYIVSQVQLNWLFDDFVERGIIPSAYLMRMEKKVRREFTIFKDTYNQTGMVTFHSLGRHTRPPGYYEIVQEAAASFCGTEKAKWAGREVVNHLTMGLGASAQWFTNEALGERHTPTAETQRFVLKKQQHRCFDRECQAEFGEDEPWFFEHVRPVKDGGRDATPANIVAVCEACMKEKNNRERVENAYRGGDKMYTSFLNPAVMKGALEPDDNMFHTWAMVQKFSEDPVPEDHAPFEFDLNLCRGHLFRGERKRAGWGIYGVCDEWEPFTDGDASKVGYYWVETTDNTLFHGDGAYQENKVCTGLAHGLIEPSDIKQTLRPMTILPADTFEDIVRATHKHVQAGHDALAAKGWDEETLKVAIKKVIKDYGGNLQVGVLGQSLKHHFIPFVTLDERELREVEKDPAFVSAHETTSAGRSAWDVLMAHQVVRDGWVRNIYNAIVEDERVEVFLMKKRIEAAGGTVVYVKTDAVGGHIPNAKWPALEAEVKRETYMHVPPVPGAAKLDGRPLKWKVKKELDDPPRPHRDRCRVATRLTRPINIPKWPCRWNGAEVIFDDPAKTNPVPAIRMQVGSQTLDEVRETARTAIGSGGSFFMTGEGGSGKTFQLTRGFIPEMQKRKIPFLIVTSTLVTREPLRAVDGCRDLAVCVQHLLKKYNKSPSKLVSALPFDGAQRAYLIVDEVSMLNDGAWQMLSVLRNYMSELRFIFIGDFNQLPPVIDGTLIKKYPDQNGTATYRDSAVLRYLSGGNIMVLTHSHRLVEGQEAFRDRCYAVARGEEIDLSNHPVKDEHAKTHLCYTNAKCKEVNAECDAYHLEQYVKQNPEGRIVRVAAAPARVYRSRPAPAPTDEGCDGEAGLEDGHECLIESDDEDDEDAAPPPQSAPSGPKRDKPTTSSKKKRFKRGSQDLTLVPGTRLVGIDSGAGKPEGGGAGDYKVYNRQRYEVVAATASELTLALLGTGLEDVPTVTIDTPIASKFLAPGWAVTLHCVQGITLDEVYTVHEWHYCRATKLARYVAVSRATRGEYVQIVDEPYDTLRPKSYRCSSAMAVRKEFVDAKAWEELRDLAHAELDADSDGLAYFKRFEQHVRAESFDSEDPRYFVLTRYGTTTGRRTAYVGNVENAGIPLQQLAKPLHTALLCARGHDLDIKKAHPTLLVQYLAAFADSPDVPHIAAYVVDAKSVHARIAEELGAAGRPDVEEKAIKRSINRAMFLGKLQSWLRKELGIFDSVEEASPTLAQLVADFNRAAAFVAEKNPQAVANAKSRHTAQGRQEYANPIAGAVSEVINGIETKVVAAVEDSLVGESGMAVRAVVYDGLVAHPVDDAVNTIDASALRLAEQGALEQTGYAVELVEKELYKAGGVAKAMAFLRDYSSTKP